MVVHDGVAADLVFLVPGFGLRPSNYCNVVVCCSTGEVKLERVDGVLI